jgi:hypothetical protein
MPQPQKNLNLTITLPKDLEDIGYKELILKDHNGILVTVDDTRFPFYFDIRSFAIMTKNTGGGTITNNITKITCRL